MIIHVYIWKEGSPIFFPLANGISGDFHFLLYTFCMILTQTAPTNLV